jgi:RNA polymerase sigma-70 factor (ECF subfamily)
MGGLDAMALEAEGSRLEAEDDRGLLRRYRQGDRRAAELLVDRSYGLVYGALYRLSGGDAELSADLTQETFRRAWKALPDFRARAGFSTWLYRIAYNAFLNHVRGPRRLVPLDERQADRLPASSPTPDESACSAQTAGHLRRAVLELDEKLRFVVTARFWGERPTSEIAALEGVSEVSIRKRLRRALGLLAGRLGEAES